jgi:hypothetical protein
MNGTPPQKLELRNVDIEKAETRTKRLATFVEKLERGKTLH